MELLLPFVLIILVIVVLSKLSTLRDHISRETHDLRDELQHVKIELRKLLQETASPERFAPPAPPPPPAYAQRNPERLEAIQREVVANEQRLAPEPPAPKESWFQQWMRNNPDLEKFIGENLANKIGIAVLVLGIAFFVKYAIDQDWIKETGRVAIGLACGALLAGLAHYLRNKYRSFSSVLVGGGLAVFYFTIAFAFHEYQLLSQQLAFVIMVVITIFAVVLSLLYNRQEIAVLAVIGGFLTPFLVTTGSNNYIALFTYLSILNSGMLVLAYFRRWPLLNVLSFAFTVLIYGGWFIDGLYADHLPYKAALLFACIFYGQFVGMAITNNLREKRQFAAFDLISVLSINALFYGAGIACLNLWSDGLYKGLFTGLLGVINLALAFVLFRRRQVDKNFIYALIGLTLTYISLAAPVQLSGNNITLFWAAETVVLLWLYQRSRIALLRLSVPLLTLLMLISLFMDWQTYYEQNILFPVIINRTFITSVVAGISLLANSYLLGRQADEMYWEPLRSRDLQRFFFLSGVACLYATGWQEIQYQFSTRYPGAQLPLLYFPLFTTLFAAVFFVLFKQPATKSLYIRFILSVAGVLVFAGCAAWYVWMSSQMLQSGQNKAHFTANWFSAVLLCALLLHSLFYYLRNRSLAPQLLPAITWFLAVALVYIISMETMLAWVWLRTSAAASFTQALDMYRKAGLTITWSVCSFVMMWLGMKHRYKLLRVISLVLFLLALIKLFFFDIRNIGPGGKIAAFIMLGVLLLVVSFMYQRLKQLFIEDAQQQNI